MNYPVKVHAKFLPKLEKAHEDLLAHKLTRDTAQAMFDLAQKSFNDMLELTKEAQVALGEIDPQANIRNLYEGWMLPPGAQPALEETLAQ